MCDFAVERHLGHGHVAAVVPRLARHLDDPQRTFVEDFARTEQVRVFLAPAVRLLFQDVTPQPLVPGHLNALIHWVRGARGHHERDDRRDVQGDEQSQQEKLRHDHPGHAALPAARGSQAADDKRRGADCHQRIAHPRGGRAAVVAANDHQHHAREHDATHAPDDELEDEPCQERRLDVVHRADPRLDRILLLDLAEVVGVFTHLRLCFPLRGTGVTVHERNRVQTTNNRWAALAT